MEITDEAQWGQVGLLCFHTGVSKIVVEFSKGSHQCEQVAIFATVETNRPSFTYFQRHLGVRKQSEKGIGAVSRLLENSVSKICSDLSDISKKRWKEHHIPSTLSS